MYVCMCVCVCVSMLCMYVHTSVRKSGKKYGETDTDMCNSNNPKELTLSS